MSRASAATKANGAARPPAPLPDEFQMIPLLRITESAANPRKRFDPEKLQELAQSIRQHGVIEPVIVRPHALLPGASVQNYELICGARRFRACAMAEKLTIPAIIRQMSDKDVLEVMCIENANREDVHPLEEGEAFLKLVQLHGATVQQLAEKIGKSDRYVQRRLKLAGMIPEAKECYFEGKLTLEHYNILARLEPAVQAKALRQAWSSDYSRDGDDYGYFPAYDRPRPVKEFEETVRAKFFLSLKTAPWDLTDPKLWPVAGACSNCTKRTGASPLLFDEAEKTDHCLDSDCFDSKRKLYLIDTEKAAKKAGTPLLRVATSFMSPSELASLKCLPSYGAYEKVTKNNRCPHTQRAVVVVGDNVGAQFDVCADLKCKQHMGKQAAGASQRNANHDENRRKREIVDAVVDQVIKGVLAKVPKKLEKREWLIIARELADMGHLSEAAELLGMRHQLPDGYQAQQNAFLAELQASSESELGRAMVAMCLVALSDECFDEVDETLISTAREYGVDVKAIEKSVAASIAAEDSEEKPVRAGKKKATKPVAEAKRAAANDADYDFEEESDGGEEYAEE